jgi:hypothetical protein
MIAGSKQKSALRERQEYILHIVSRISHQLRSRFLPKDCQRDVVLRPTHFQIRQKTFDLRIACHRQ